MPGTNAIGKPIWPIATSAAFVGVLFLFASAHAAEQAAAGPAQQKSAERSASTTKPSVVAWVDSSPIYYADVERAIAGARGKKIDPDKLPRIQAAALADLIQQKVLSKFLESAQLQPTTAEVDTAMADFKKKLEDQKLTLNQYFEQTKKTEASLRKQLGMEIALQKYIAKSTTDDNLQQYFHDHRPDFDGTERRVSHILDSAVRSDERGIDEGGAIAGATIAGTNRRWRNHVRGGCQEVFRRAKPLIMGAIWASFRGKAWFRCNLLKRRLRCDLGTLVNRSSIPSACT